MYKKIILMIAVCCTGNVLNAGGNRPILEQDSFKLTPKHNVSIVNYNVSIAPVELNENSLEFQTNENSLEFQTNENSLEFQTNENSLEFQTLIESTSLNVTPNTETIDFGKTMNNKEQRIKNYLSLFPFSQSVQERVFNALGDSRKNVEFFCRKYGENPKSFNTLSKSQQMHEFFNLDNYPSEEAEKQYKTMKKRKEEIKEQKGSLGSLGSLGRKTLELDAADLN